jgi:uncharacterized membrane protein
MLVPHRRIDCVVLLLRNLNYRTIYHVVTSGVLGVLMHAQLFKTFDILPLFLFKFLLLSRVQLCKKKKKEKEKEKEKRGEAFAFHAHV